MRLGSSGPATGADAEGEAAAAVAADAGGAALFKPAIIPVPIAGAPAYTGVSRPTRASDAPPAEHALPNDSVNDDHFAGASIGDPARVALQQHLAGLRLEHRDLDVAIERMQQAQDSDELAIRRLKRRKLLLKDQIARLVRELDPDVLA